MTYSKLNISTPSLIINKNNLLSNINKMNNFSKKNKINIRPHSKSHKMIKIAKTQLKYGACGICVATLYEAEKMVENKIKGVLLTTPITNIKDKVRLKNLFKLSDSFMIVIDNIYSINFLSNIVKPLRKKINVLVDCDIMYIGKNKISRTGARSIKEIISLAKIINQNKYMNFRGITAYAGDIQHINNYNKRSNEAKVRYNYLKNIIMSLKNNNLDPEIISGGGTGSHELDAKSKLFTELQPGSYIFNDVEYNNVSIYKSNNKHFSPALIIGTSVISRINKKQYVVDAGLKAISADSNLMPLPMEPTPFGTKYSFLGDEHGKITLPKNSKIELSLGDKVYIQPAHCDPTINLYDKCLILDENKSIKTWNIDARGYG